MGYEDVVLYNELSKWGMNTSTLNGSLSPQYCERLYTTLTNNYPCMKEGICTPFSDVTIVIIIVGVLVTFFALGYYVAKKQYEVGQNG